MRIVFCGTPDFACPSLRALVDAGIEVPLVVSQPDRVRGRRAKPTPSPVRQLALDLGLETAVLEKGARDRLYQRILSEQPDAVAVVAFGHIVREPLLHAAPWGCVNVHASLLPRWRGPAPVHTSIVAGDAETGVCTMRLEAGVDTGDVYLRANTPISGNETAGELHDRLAALGGPLLVRTLRGLSDGSVAAHPQSTDGVTHAPMLKKTEGSVDFETSAQRAHDRIRGLSPWPGITVVWRGRSIKVHGSRLDHEVVSAVAPGTVTAIDEGGARIACGDGSIRIAALQAEGKRAVSAMEFARGHGLVVGDRFSPVSGFLPEEPRA